MSKLVQIESNRAAQMRVVASIDHLFLFGAVGGWAKGKRGRVRERERAGRSLCRRLVRVSIDPSGNIFEVQLNCIFN